MLVNIFLLYVLTIAIFGGKKALKNENVPFCA